MMCPLLMSLHSSILNHRIPMERFYSYCGITRQGFLKKRSKYTYEKALVSKLVKQIVDYRKNIDRRAGSRSLYYNLDIGQRYGIGINKFEMYVSEAGLSLVPMRIKVVTTQSCYQSWNHENLCNGLEINDINQLIVGDITYLNIGGQRYYLFCLTDVFSNRIVGYSISKRMRSIEAIEALQRCVNLRSKESLLNCIHHTDGGKQYFSKDYQSLINKLEIKISVAKTCLENGYAEQKNGLIKMHLIPTIGLVEKKVMQPQLQKMIHNHNFTRKQKLLGWLSPNDFEIKLKTKEYKPKLILHNHLKNLPSKRIGF